MLPEEFTPADLYAALPTAEDIDLDPILLADTVRMVHWLSASSYEVIFDSALTPIRASDLARGAGREPRDGGRQVRALRR